MYSITVSGHFDSGHWLRNYEGKCANPHGHRFTYQIVIQGEKLNDQGILIDFTNIKQFMKDVIEEKFDHKMLNEVPPFDKINPTAENLAHSIYVGAYNMISGNPLPVIRRHCKVTRVRVYESPDCWSEYSE